MKRFTIVSSILLVLLMAGTLVFVHMSPDFVAPSAKAGEGEDPNAPVWNMSMDDMIDYLEEKGFWDRSSMGVLSGGVATEAYACSGAELYWWDLDNLAEGSNEEAASQDALAGEPIDLWQQGTMFMSVTKNGPFALSLPGYTGDAKAILDAFSAFGQTGSDADDPVWDMKMEDLLQYLEDKGYIDRSTSQLLAGGIGSEAYMFSGLEIFWWDLENLEESSEEYKVYQDLQDGDGVVLIYGNNPYSLTGNGPFGLHIRDDFSGDVNQLTDDFLAFGH